MDLKAKVLNWGHFALPHLAFYLAMPKDIFGVGCYWHLVNRGPEMPPNILSRTEQHPTIISSIKCARVEKPDVESLRGKSGEDIGPTGTL